MDQQMGLGSQWAKKRYSKPEFGNFKLAQLVYIWGGQRTCV